ncbi:MAG: mechanosensitive ion channel family protein [Betaproteobacteria bacterium]
MFKKYLSWSFYTVVVLSNLIVAGWLMYTKGSPFGWKVANLGQDNSFVLHEILAIAQFGLIGFTFDVFFRYFVRRYNKDHPDDAWSDILIQASVVIFYVCVGFLGFISLYEHSISTIIASTSALGFFVTYAARNLISDIVSSISMQKNKLMSIGDYIETRDGDKIRLQVKKMDFRYVTFLNDSVHLTRIPNQRVLSMSFVNISQQDNGSERVVDLQLGVHNSEDRIIDLLNSAADYVCNHIPGFINTYSTSVLSVSMNIVTYRIVYRCKPDLSFAKTRGIMLRHALRFLKGAGIVLSTIEYSRSTEQISQSAAARLIELYPFGVLKALNVDEVESLASRVKLVQFAPGEYIIRQGDTDDCMYIIAEGGVEVLIDKDGQPLSVAKLWPGDCFGEMSLLTGEPRKASILAQKFTTLILINKIDIAPLLNEDSLLVGRLSQMLAERMAHSQAMMNQSDKNEMIDKNRKSIAQKILSFFGKKSK